MMPGPVRILACPHCQGLAKLTTYESGNTVGARVWTDGRQVAPMMPSTPAVVECRHCGKSHWLAEAKEVGSIEPSQRGANPADPAWAAATEVKEPAADAYYRAIKAGLAKTREEERALRIRAWWRANDALRKADPELGNGATPISEEGRANLRALLRLLRAKNPNDQMMKAEVLRQLGDFDAATLILLPFVFSDLGTAAKQLLSLCVAKDSRLRELKLGA